MAVICAIIARKRHRMVVKEMADAARKGAGMVELRLDFLQHAIRLTDLMKRKKTPCLATLRRKRDGGLWTGDEDTRLQLLRETALDGADWIDVEEDVAHLVKRKGPAKRLVSYHNFERVPEDLPDIQRRMENLDPDAVKFACKAGSAVEALRMLALLRTARVPTVALAMGEWGVATRVLGAKLGSPWCYAAMNTERLVAPGLLTVEDMRGVYRCHRIDAATEVYGVLGDPVAQSLSPLVHNAGFAKLGLNKVYLPFRVAREEFHAFLAALDELVRPRGFSVTIPHKQAAAELGTARSPAVQATHAANTLLRRDAGWELDNTDVEAAAQAAANALPVDPDTGMRSFFDRPVLVLGAGGVARAVAYGLKERGAHVTVVARKRADADRLAALVGCRSIDWEERFREHYDLIANGTPLGMAPNLGESPYHGSALKPTTAVFDTVYNPENTALVAAARERGCGVATGVEMFVGQAEAQFRQFAGQDPPRGLMARLVREALSPARKMLREARLAEDAAAPARAAEPAPAAAPDDDNDHDADAGDEEEGPLPFPLEGAL